MTVTPVRDLKRVLPRTYCHRREVLSEISTVLSQHQSLQPVLDRFVFNDGTARTLVGLTGTIKVFYEECSNQNTSTCCGSGKRYNIPVSLWLKESYPRTAPICYVKPTPEMVIVASRHVNSSGEILMPYLDEWTHMQCDLHSLIQVMKVVFSEVPPLRICLYPKDCSAYHKPSAEEISHVMLDREDDLPFSEHNETIC
ncbi:tumor susceptibility gene 101 protein isoform X2 [Carassius gibelio]|uniref:tumor susceptibility gene 101 protein isoform X2 n=1 Tax=Carassius gibelio TaxID=101364 RepID=UPI0022786C89|nr:tumor susceptibility gene 101 protein isoform X2 [Carassius gibelio]